MAFIAEDRRPNRIIVDYVDAGGQRHWKTFPKTTDGRRQARIFAGECERKLIRGEAGQDERVTFEEAAKRWLLHCSAALSRQTAVNYSTVMAQHLYPRMGHRPLAKVTRAAFKLAVAELLTAGTLKRSSVRTVVATARAFFSWCVEDGLILSNPAAMVPKALKLSGDKGGVVKSMTGTQLSAFLGASSRVLNEDGDLEMLLYARTGVRLGEGHGFQWCDFLDDERPRLRVARQVTQLGEVKPPKTANGTRMIDVPQDLLLKLRETWARRHEERLRLGIPMSGWILHPEFGETPSRAHVKAARAGTASNMAKVIHAATLPKFTPHCLRHTYATQLLLQGEPLQYVQRALGHATISETADTYGSWLQAESPGAVDRLSDRTKAKESAEVGEFKSGALPRVILRG